MANATDLPIVEPPGRISGPNALAEAISAVYQSLLLTQKYDRQARAGLIAVTTIEVPPPVSVASLTVSNPPTQAEVQAIVARVNANAGVLNQVLTILEFIKQAMDSNIQTLN